MTVLWGHLAFSWNREQWPCELIHARPVVRTNQNALLSVFFSSTIFFICFFLQVPTPEIRAHNLYLDLSCLWDQDHVCNRGIPELASENQTSRFPCEKSMNLLTPIDGFGMSSLWFQSCWISPSYFQQLSNYRENWVRIHLYFDHLRNSIVPSTLCGFIFK